jgi:hypothetical protein
VTWQLSSVGFVVDYVVRVHTGGKFLFGISACPCRFLLWEYSSFYNLYSWEIGFGVRFGRDRKNDAMYTTRQDIVCSCEVWKFLNLSGIIGLCIILFCLVQHDFVCDFISISPPMYRVLIVPRTQPQFVAKDKGPWMVYQ